MEVDVIGMNPTVIEEMGEGAEILVLRMTSILLNQLQAINSHHRPKTTISNNSNSSSSNRSQIIIIVEIVEVIDRIMVNKLREWE